jgi:membrane-associated phospholipid phosphatase
VLGWSRVSLGRHSWAEVALGLAIGTGTALAIQAMP